MRTALFVLAPLLAGCAVERVGPPGVTLTRPVRVEARHVRAFHRLADVEGRYSVVDDVFVEDDGVTAPRILERRLCELAGARGANAIVPDPLNRPLNGTRIDLRPTFDKPFQYFSATAIWIGDGERPVKDLGALGRHGRGSALQ